MTDKEKLVGIIDDCRTYVAQKEVLADHLLSNGVTIPKYGRWIIHHEAGGRHSRTRTWAECSECHVCGSPQWKVCPVCETRMEKHSAINIEEVDFDYAAEDDNA